MPYVGGPGVPIGAPRGIVLPGYPVVAVLGVGCCPGDCVAPTLYRGGTVPWDTDVCVMPCGTGLVQGWVGLSGEVGGVGAEGVVVAVLRVGAAGAIVVGVVRKMGFPAGGLSGGMVLPLLLVSGWM